MDAKRPGGRGIRPHVGNTVGAAPWHERSEYKATVGKRRGVMQPLAPLQAGRTRSMTALSRDCIEAYMRGARNRRVGGLNYNICRKKGLGGAGGKGVPWKPTCGRLQ